MPAVAALAALAALAAPSPQSGPETVFTVVRGAASATVLAVIYGAPPPGSPLGV